MEAPERLYVDTDDRLSDSILYGFTEKRKDDDIEYTRTDVVIDKACEGIDHLLSDYIIRNFHCGDSYNIDRLIEDFKNYMKEE